MTLLAMNGFDLGDHGIRYFGLGSFGGAYPFDITRTRFGYGLCLGLKDGAFFTQVVAPSATVVVGVAWGAWELNSLARVSVFGDAGTVEHVRLSQDSAGHLVVSRAGTVLATSSDVVLPYGVIGSIPYWRYIEMKVTISDTVGTVQVRVDGGVTPVINLTGVDTRNGGSSTNIDAVGISNPPGAYAVFDDLYVLNTLGSVNNDFLGDVRVMTLSPNADGSSSDLVNSGGNSISNYSFVDEKPWNSVDYVESTVSGARDTYNVENLPPAAITVYAAQSLALVKRPDSGIVSMKTVVKSGATLSYGPVVVLSTNWTALVKIEEADPATAAPWTTSAVNSVEVGAEVV